MRGLKRNEKLACLCVVHLLNIFTTSVIFIYINEASLFHINLSCPQGLSANVVTFQQRVIEAGKNLQQNAIFKGSNDTYCRGRIFKFTIQKLIPWRNERPEDLELYHIHCHFFNPLGSSFPQ